jgi:hypothetical protein
VFRRDVLQTLKTGFIVGFIVLAFHAYWFVPATMSTRDISLPSGYTSVSQLDFLSFASWKHTLLFQQPHWFENIFGKINRPRYEFAIFPLLALASIYLYRKSRETWYWAIILGISVFLAKGNSWPWGGIYIWLFNNLPGFNLFRDPVKFYFLIALAYSVLIGRIKSIKIIIIMSLVMLGFNWPAISEKLTGTFSTPRYEKEYQAVNEIIGRDQKWSRTLWIPKRYPMGSSDYLHPISEAVDLSRLRSFATGTVGNYETINYLREASFSGGLLNMLGVRYLVYPAQDPLRDDLKVENQLYHATFSGQLATLPWIESTREIGPLRLFEMKNKQDQFFIPENTSYVVGSDDIYNTGLDPTKTALIFAEEQPNTKNANFQVVLNRKSNLDLAVSSIPQSSFIFPARKLSDSPDVSGWWRRNSLDFSWWRDFLQTKYGLDNQDFDYGGGLAISEGANKLTLPVNKGLLLARVMSSSRSGEIIFLQNGRPIGSVNTLIKNPSIKTIKLTGYKSNPDKYYQYSQADFAWHEIGPVDLGKIVVNTAGDINVLNALAVVPKLELSNDFNKTFETVVEQSPLVEYKQNNPTHYKVKISGLKKPSVLVFSQSFDPYWKLNGKSPIKVYSLVNGFSVDKDGDYDLYYEPQKYVIFGLTVSGFISLLMFYFLIRK